MSVEQPSGVPEESTAILQIGELFDDLDVYESLLGELPDLENQLLTFLDELYPDVDGKQILQNTYLWHKLIGSGAPYGETEPVLVGDEERARKVVKMKVMEFVKNQHQKVIGER